MKTTTAQSLLEMGVIELANNIETIISDMLGHQHIIVIPPPEGMGIYTEKNGDRILVLNNVPLVKIEPLKIETKDNVMVISHTITKLIGDTHDHKETSSKT